MTPQQLSDALNAPGKRPITARELANMCQIKESTVLKMLGGQRKIANSVIYHMIQANRWPLPNQE